MAKTYGDRWVVRRTFGEGGQAHAFQVTDAKAERETAHVLKRIKNVKRLDRFKREVEAVSKLSHENVVRLIDFDLDCSRPYLVMEYCAGGSLASATPYWANSPVVALNLFQEICSGVAYAHLHGVIHRDLKPENIFLRTSSGPAVVGDFGICFLDDEGERITLTEEAVGPRLFIAPELEDGRVDQVSKKADSYALGKVLYWLVSGGRTFSREKHREQGWDLKGWNQDSVLGWNNVYLEHVNRLLDYMIVRDPGDRLEVSAIQILARRAIRLVQKEYNPVGRHIPQPCTYCGEGRYELRAAGDPTAVRNFGFEVIGTADWRIFTCSECGHVQAFRVDFAKKEDKW